MKYNRRRRNSGKSVPIEYYLRFTALEDCTFKFVYSSNFDVGLVLYSNDEGKNWIEWPHSKYLIRVKSGDSVIWKQDAENVYADNNGIGHFVTTGRFNISGSISSLIDGKLQHDGFTDKSYAFKGLFEDTSVVNARELVLLYDNVPPHCYEEMFKNCQYLEGAPSIMGITTLSEYCCSYMFYGCTSLTSSGGNVSNNLYLAPYCFSHMFEGCTTMLSAKMVQGYMATNCCEYMFKDCTSLHAASQMNILGLAPYCFLSMYHGSGITSANITTQDKNPATGSYSYMFGACPNLTEAQFDLSATTLATECYMGMFANCDKLEVGPRILTRNFPNEENSKCCANMFSGCESLSSIYCFAQNNITGNSNNFQNWVYNVADSGTFYGFDNLWPTGFNGIPTNWVLSDLTYAIQYFTIESLSDNNTIKGLNTGGSTMSITYSLDGGTTWKWFYPSSQGTNFATLNTGETVLLRSNQSNTFALNLSLSGTDSFKVYGNLMSLTRNNDFINASIKSNKFQKLFENATTLIDASNLVLPNDVYDSCYYSMFENCTSLIAPPSLPANTMKSSCYSSMFWGCSSLTVTPNLPAMTMADNCYAVMFRGCTALVTVSELPATTLAYQCYDAMFDGCTSLVTAPELPATTLAYGCYSTMFRNCTSLTTAPDLLVSTLPQSSYSFMFDGCSSLNYIKCLATSKQNGSLARWARGVAAHGTLVKDSTSTIWINGESGIPSGWTVQDA